MCADTGGSFPVIRSPSCVASSATSTDTGTASVRNAIANARLSPPSVPSSRRPRQVGHDDHPERLRGEDEHDVHGVRGEEAVGLRRPPELVREQRSRAGRGERDDDLGEPGQEAAADGAPALRGAGGFHAPDQSRHSRTLTVP